MIVYKFREYDRAYDGPVELPDAPGIPKYHTFQAPPEQEGHWPFMRNGWVLYPGGKPDIPEPDYAGEAASQVRQERNKLLLESDWTQVADSPVDLVSWAIYRETLRNIPNQEGFPFNVEWPQKPE
jgi:hypothetical protein